MKTILKPLLGGIAALISVPALIGQMKLSPSDELFALACENIKVNQSDLLRQRPQFWLDAAKMAVRGPFSDIDKRRSLSDRYSVEVGEYLNYLNAKLLNNQAQAVVLSEITIEIGSGGVMIEEFPVFTVRMSGTDSSGRKMEAKKAANGPAYSTFKVQNIYSHPVAVRSANIACFAAFLRTVLALEKQLGAAAPKKSGNQVNRTSQPVCEQSRRKRSD